MLIIADMPKIFRLLGFFKRNKFKTNTENDFVVISETSSINTEYAKNLIKENMNNNSISKISEWQKNAHRYDQNICNNVICGICYDSYDLAKLACAHEICRGCYSKLLDNSFKNCPVCDIKMEIVDVQKLYAYIRKIDHGIVILYLPPIYRESIDTWIENEICMDEKSINEAINNISYEKYKIVVDDSGTKDLLYRCKGLIKINETIQRNYKKN